MVHNKLVRDKIPEIIQKRGVKFKTHIANNKEYAEKLRDKLEEEVNEFLADNNTEELADILEVMYALCETFNLSFKDLEKIRKQKHLQRGGFTERIILDNTD